MNIKVKTIYWFLLIYCLFYCINPLLFGNNVRLINSLIILLVLFVSLLRNNLKKDDFSYLFLFLIYSAYILIQTLGSNLITSTFSVFKFYIIYPSVVLIGATASFLFVNEAEKEQELIWKILWGWGVLLLLLAVYELITSDYVVKMANMEKALYSYSGGRTLGLIRARVFSSSYLTLGDIFGMLSITSLFLFVKFKNKMYLFFTYAFFAGVFFASSRGSIVGTAVAFLMLYIIRDNKNFGKINKKHIKWIVLTFSLVFFVFMLGKNNEVINYWIKRVTTIFDWTSKAESNDVRLEHWMTYLKLWTATPRNFFIGTGGLTAGYESLLGVTESGFIEHLVEVGLVGSILYYSLMLIPFIRFLKRKTFTHFGKWILACFTILFVHDFVLQVSVSDDICLLMWLLVMLMYIENYRIEFIEKRE